MNSAALSSAASGASRTRDRRPEAVHQLDRVQPQPAHLAAHMAAHVGEVSVLGPDEVGAVTGRDVGLVPVVAAIAQASHWRGGVRLGREEPSEGEEEGERERQRTEGAGHNGSGASSPLPALDRGDQTLAINGGPVWVRRRTGKRSGLRAGLDRPPRDDDFFLGTLAPFFRASESPIAIACLRLFTDPPWPDLPRLRVPFFRRCIALFTDRLALLLYFRPLFFAGMEPPGVLCGAGAVGAGAPTASATNISHLGPVECCDVDHEAERAAATRPRATPSDPPATRPRRPRTSGCVGSARDLAVPLRAPYR